MAPEDLPLPPPPGSDGHPRRLATVSWLTILAAVALALGAIVVFPRSGGDAPPLASLALVGAVVTGVSTAALYLIVRRDLGLPRRLAGSFASAFALVGLVKFVLAPFGLYEVNAVRALDDVVGTVGDVGGTTLTAAVVFALYAAVYAAVGRAVRGKRDVDSSVAPRRLVTILVILGVLVVSGLGLIALLLLTAPRQYVEFVFSSGSGLLVGAALAGAAALLGSVFRTVARRPDVVAGVGAALSLFWLGLGFLALYHALWIAYVLVLASIWPLRTVVPK